MWCMFDRNLSICLDQGLICLQQLFDLRPVALLLLFNSGVLRSPMQEKLYGNMLKMKP